ncbi:interleukin-34 isoform X2 [Cuculus canorus]|uniref:interleukin-34 isoform X2 n=1 Tax=Cuculus canorus TaxID=55661 RepID=UPI0023AA3D43|nr:interleukin-34 isoform X2 [Cuculus canorus]
MGTRCEGSRPLRQPHPRRSLPGLPLGPDKLIAGITVLGWASPGWKSPRVALPGAGRGHHSPRHGAGALRGLQLQSLPTDPLSQRRGVPHLPERILPAPCDGPATCCLPTASWRGEASGDSRGEGLIPHPWQGAAAGGYRRAAQRPGPAPAPRPPATGAAAQGAPGQLWPCRCSPGSAATMQQGYAAVLCVLAVLGLEAAAPGECELTRLLQDKLQYEMRLQYMKHYFPIDYMVQVQYEEVLRPANITRLRNGTVSEAALRYLWFHISSQAVLRIHEVLPEKHPSWKYTRELCQLFDALGQEYSKYRQTDVETVVADLVKLVYSADARSRRKAVRPKALLDNCLKVMRMLYGAPCRWEFT